MPVGVASSPSPPASTCQPRASSSTAGTGTGRLPCAAWVRPDPTATGLAVTRLTPRSASAAHTPDDVRDRVPRPHLVEVDVVGGDAVHAALGVGEPGEDGEGRVPDRRGQLRRLQQRPDPRPRAVRVTLVEALDVDLERAQACPRHRARPHVDLAGHDGGDGGPHRVEGGAGVEQRAEQHVARDPCGGVDPQLRGCLGGHTRNVTTRSIAARRPGTARGPGPNPLAHLRVCNRYGS